MRKTEMREVTVYYCDVCGAEIVGNMTTFNQGLADEKHACHAFIENEEIRCDQKLERQQAAQAILPTARHDPHCAASRRLTDARLNTEEKD